MGRSAPRSVLITGASSGIGRSCAMRMDRVGWQVFAGVRKLADAESLREASSGRLTPVLLDVTDPDQIQAAAAQIARQAGVGGLGGLVNNAGIAIAGPLEFLPLEAIRNQFEVNVIGHISVTQAVLSLLRTGRGRIVNIGSIAGKLASPFIGPYAMSKYALEAFTDSLRRELLPWDIHVCIIEAGRVDTSIWHKSIQTALERIRRLPPQVMEFYGPVIDRLEKRMANAGPGGAPPEEVARVVEHALGSERPRTRYLVGRDAKTRILLTRLLSDRFFDDQVRKALYS